MVLTAELAHKNVASAVFGLMIELVALNALRDMESFHNVEATASVENFPSFQEPFLGRDREPKSDRTLLFVLELAFDVDY